MNRLLKTIVLIVLSYSTLCFSQETPQNSPDFTYSIQQHPRLEKETDALLQAFDLFFEDRELTRVIIPSGITEKKTSLETLNRIYSGQLGNTVVFVRTGVIPSLPELMEKSVQIQDGYLSHIKQPSGLVVAFYVKSSSWENASEIIQSLKTKFVVDYKPKKSNFSIFKTAHAAEAVDCETKPAGTEELNQLASSSLAVSNASTPIQHITGCTMSALKGVWNGSGGAVIDLAKAAGNLITSPIETGKAYWESAKKLWDVTSNFFSDFQNEARKLYSSFDSLDPLVKTKLACEIIGTIGGGVLMTYFTAGVAGSSVALQIKKALESVLKLEKFSGARKALIVNKAKIKVISVSAEKNLFSIPRGTPAASVVKNKKVLSDLEKFPVELHSATRKAGFTETEIHKLFQQVSDHPVASTSLTGKYSKNTPGMGYCFGRATTAHIKAITNGLDKGSVRKVWAVGDLKTGSANWRYHVTTVVRDSKNKWHAIDPVMGKAMPVEEWYQKMKVFDSKGDMRIFQTEAKRMGPSSQQKYSREIFSSKQYEGYFEDLMSSFRKETSELAAQRKLMN